MNNRTRGEKIFNIFNILLLTLIILITIYPFYYTFIASISDGTQVIRGKVLFYPVNPTLKAYRLISTIRNFGTAYGNTIFYTVVGASTSLMVMSMGAYALSRKRLKGRRIISLLISFTMWFQAGMIPFYLNLDSLNLLDSRLGIIIAFACSAFYIIILRSYFEGLPIELEEAAKIDGMSNFGIFTKVMLPLSTPVLATIGLYCAVDRWNGYFWAMIILKDVKKVPLQVLIKKLIIENQVLASIDTGTGFDFTQETLVYAIVIIAILPIIVIYPFVQKFFVKGLTIGSVKG